MRTCINCKKVFQPSKQDRHLKCPTCRHNGYKKPCAICGKLVRFASTICSQCLGKKQRMGGHPRWIGGKRTQSEGYVLEYTPLHPKAHCNNGYVLEHRLVMEKHLGRFLESNENVHHINGVRNDNRLSNLELWTTCQPCGIRVKDAVSWAKEVIQKYGDNESIY